MPVGDSSRRQELRDRGGRLLGTICARNGGTLEARDAGAGLKGTYDPETNETRDAGGHLVGTGNQLSMLLTRKD